MIILLGTLALACFVSMVVALLVGIKLAAELQDEKRARRTPCGSRANAVRKPAGSPRPPEWVNGEASRGGNQ